MNTRSNSAVDCLTVSMFEKFPEGHPEIQLAIRQTMDIEVEKAIKNGALGGIVPMAETDR